MIEQGATMSDLQKILALGGCAFVLLVLCGAFLRPRPSARVGERDLAAEELRRLASAIRSIGVVGPWPEGDLIHSTRRLLNMAADHIDAKERELVALRKTVEILEREVARR